MIAPAGKGEHQQYTPYLHPAIPFGHEYLSKSTEYKLHQSQDDICFICHCALGI